MRPDLTAVSLFAGIGGFELGLTRAGIRVVAGVEIDEAARGVLADRFPDLTLYSDVREVTGDQLIAAGFVPERGIVCAGWPCQGNSVAGRRGGMDDPRSGLWRHVVRLLAETRARWFIGENVPGLLSVRNGRDWATCIRDLADLGMGFSWRVLDAQHFGVPQRRRRVIVVGRAGGDPTGPIEVLLEPKGGRRDPAPGRAARPGTARVAALSASDGGADDNDATGGRLIVGPLQAPGSGGRGHRLNAEGAATGHLVAAPVRPSYHGDHVAAESHLVLNALTSHAGRNEPYADPLVPIAFDVAQITHPENRINPRPGDPAMPLAATGQPHVAYALRRDPGTPQGHNTSLVTHALTAEGADASEDGTGRGTPLVQTEKRDAVATATAVRRLTPRECERLQGFPDDWTATSGGRPQSDSARYRQLGNAVAAPVIAWVARRLAAVEERLVS